MRIVCMVLALAAAGTSFAGEALSPIDAKYKARDAALFEDYRKAQALVTDYRGERDKLLRANKLLADVLEQDPDFAPAYREFGRIYIITGFNIAPDGTAALQAARQSIENAIAREPAYADAYVLLGHFHTLTGDLKAAKEALETAEQIGTDQPWLSLNWADLYREIGEHDLAFDRYRQVVERGTDNRKALLVAMNGLRRYHRMNEDWAEAERWHKKIIAMEPDNPWARSEYAQFLLFRRGDAVASAREGEAALDIMHTSVARYTLALALYTRWAEMLEQGTSEDEAQTLFSRAFSLYPHLDKVVRDASYYEPTWVTAKWVNKFKNDYLHLPESEQTRDSKETVAFDPGV